jgi:hypothetical protein
MVPGFGCESGGKGLRRGWLTGTGTRWVAAATAAAATADL